MPSKSTLTANKSKKSKAQKIPTAKIPQVKFIKGSTDVLVIAPHGVNKKGVKRDDKRTDIVATKISEELNCSALINDSIKRTAQNYNNSEGAESDKNFIKNLRYFLHFIQNDRPLQILFIP